MSNDQNRGAPILNLDDIGGVQSTSMLKPEVISDPGLSALGSRDPQSVEVPQGAASSLHALDNALANSASAIPDTTIFQQHAIDSVDSSEPASAPAAPHAALSEAASIHTDNFAFASVSGSDAVNLNDSFASQDVVHSQFGAMAPDYSAATASDLFSSEHPLAAHLNNGLAAQNNEVHGGSQTDGGGSGGGDPDGQLWFGGEGDISGTSSGSSDDQIGHIDSDGNGRDVADVDSGTAAFQAIGIDSAAGLYFAYDSDTTLRDGHITNDTQTGQGSQIDSIAMVYGTGLSADEVESLAVDPINHIVFMGLFDQTDENTGIIEVTYNPTTGAMVSPYNASTGTITNFDGMLFDDNSSGDVGTSTVAYTNATAMYFDTSTDKLYYIDQTNGYSSNGGSGYDWHSTNGIYEVSVSGSVGTSNAPTPNQLSLNSQFAAGAANNYISGFAVDDAKSMIYFTVSDASTMTSTLWYMPIAGGSATQMTLPGGISIGIAAFFFDGSNPVALDANGQNLYISDGTDSHIVQLSLNSAGTGFNATGNNNDFMTLDSSNSNTYATALYFDNAPTLSGVHTDGTATEAVQGGSALTLLSPPNTIAISDPSSTELGFATVTISNAQAGDVLAATNTAGTSINASYNATTHTLTLSGEDTYAHYEQVLDSVTYQDTGTDNSSGSHPTRTIDWMVSDGTTFADPTTSDPNEATTTITIDRPPTVVTETASVLESASAMGTSGTGGTGGLDGDSDLDGDTLTITALTGGTLGTPLSGNYGQLTLNANGSYTYNANNTSAINSAAPGSHPVDTFTYTVSDGHGGTTTQTINISIDRPPVTVTESASAVESASATGTSGTGGTGGLDGDSDRDGDTLTISAVSGVSGNVGVAVAGTYGDLTLNANGSYTYTAGNTSAINSAATGSHPVDSFTYTVSDGHGGTTTQTINITIDRPPAVVTESNAVVESASDSGTSGTGGTGGLDGDSDLDGDTLTISAVAGSAGNVGASVAGTYGHLTLNANGSYTYTADNTSAINSAATGSHPVDTFTYTVSDSHGGTTTQTINITIDRPPAVVTESSAVVESASDSGTSGTAGTGGLASDSDPDGDTLTITAVAGSAGNVGAAVAGTYGSLTLNADGSYTYNASNTSAISSAATGSHPVDSFTYTVSDGHGGTTTQTIDITIDRPPTVQTQSETVVEFGTSTGTSGTAGTGALDGDSDPDGDSLTITAVKNASDVSGVLGSPLDGTYGILVLNANGSYSYTAQNVSAINSAATGSHPVDSFSVTVGDGNGGTTTETLNFTIDRLPTVVASGTATFDGGGSAVTLDSGATAADADGDNLTGATVTIESNYTTGDTLDFSTQNGISGSWNSSTHVLTLSGDASAANYQTALDSITYSFTPSDGDPTAGGSDTSRTIYWVVTSAAGVGSGTGSSTLDVVHVAPTVTSSGTVSYTAGGPAAVLDAGLTLADPDSGNNLTGATIYLGEGSITGDTLNFTNQNGISGSYSSGTLTLSGTATVAEYQTALESITYTFTPTSGDPTDGGSDDIRAISWRVTDGVASSNFGSSTLDVAADVAPAVSSLSGSSTSGADFASGYTATFTLDVSKDVTVAGGTTLLLSDGGTATYSSGSGTTTLTFTYDATDAPQALTVSSISAGSIEDSAGKSLPIAGTAVSGYSDAVTDSAANVASNFGSLDSAVSYISSITLNDTGTPNLDLTASEIVNDRTLIGKIVSSYNLIANDTASAIGGAFDSLETYVASISAVIFTDSGTPTLDLTQTQVTNDASLLAKVQGPYDLLVSDVTGQAYTSYQNDYNASDTLTVKTDFNTNGSETIYGYVSGLTLAGTANADTFYLQSAPSVTVTGGAGNDIFFFGKGFSASDHVTGGTGSNTLELDGNYASLAISSSMMSDIQILHLATGHSYDITLDAGVITTGQTLTVEAAELVSGNTLTFNASALTGGNLIFDTDGGSFNLTGGPGTNTFNVGGDFTASDEINGGTGTSAVHLNGNYSSGLTFNATTMVNVQTLDLAAGYSYNLTLNNATVGSGTLTINAATLGVGDSLTINGSAVDDGNLVVYAGSGSSFIEGGLGADKLYAGSGADTFAYAAVGDSTGPTFDTIFNFNSSSDKIDLIGSLTGVTAVDTAVTTGILGPTNFNTVLQHDIGASQLSAGGAVLFTPSSGGYHGDTFLIIDENGVAGYQAGQDLVIELSHIVSVSSLSVSNFETIG